MGFCREHSYRLAQSRVFSCAVAILLMMSSGAFAQSAGGSNGNGDTPDDPVGSASCHFPDSYDALWVEEQLELVIDIGKREAARQGCGKSDGDRTAYPIRLSNPDFMGQYVVMRVHGACQLSGASVLWKKSPEDSRDRSEWKPSVWVSCHRVYRCHGGGVVVREDSR